FSLAESASGAVVLAAFADLLDRAVPLAASAEIRYGAVATGDVWADASLGADVDRAAVEAEVDAGRTPRFTVDIVLRSAERETGQMTVQWALRPHRRAPQT